jgi:hypothetical protein
MIDITKVPFNKFLGISLANNPEYLLQLDNQRRIYESLRIRFMRQLYLL